MNEDPLDKALKNAKDDLVTLNDNTGLRSIIKPEQIDKIFETNPALFVSLDIVKVEEAMAVLSAYAMYIQTESNVSIAKELTSKDAYEMSLVQVRVDTQFPKNVTTKKEKDNLVLSGDARLKKLHRIADLRAKAVIFLEGQADRVENFVNVLKKIHTRRTSNNVSSD